MVAFADEFDAPADNATPKLIVHQLRWRKAAFPALREFAVSEFLRRWRMADFPAALRR